MYCQLDAAGADLGQEVILISLPKDPIGRAGVAVSLDQGRGGGCLQGRDPAAESRYVYGVELQFRSAPVAEIKSEADDRARSEATVLTSNNRRQKKSVRT